MVTANNSAAEAAVRQARTDLILDQPFFGTLALHLTFVEDSSKPTLWTDGKRLGYNPAFVTSISHNQLKAEVCHEIMHVACLHPWRLKDLDHDRANDAADYAINILMKDQGFKLGEDWLINESYRGMSTEKIYSLLSSSPNNKGQQGQQGQQGNNNQSGQGQGQGQDQDKKDPPPRSEFLPCQSDEADTLEAEAKVTVLQAAMAAKAAGKLPAGIDLLVQELKKTPVDWRSALRKFVQQTAKIDYSWVRPNSRYLPAGFYLPSVKSESMPAIVVAVDASGSCLSVQGDFLAEVESIGLEAKPEKLIAFYFDTIVNKPVQEFEAGEAIKLKPCGGGGTDFRPIFEFVDTLEDQPACLIILTDLEGPLPANAPDYPVMFACVTDLVAPFGETIKVNVEGRY